MKRESSNTIKQVRNASGKVPGGGTRHPTRDRTPPGHARTRTSSAPAGGHSHGTRPTCFTHADCSSPKNCSWRRPRSCLSHMSVHLGVNSDSCDPPHTHARAHTHTHAHTSAIKLEMDAWGGMRARGRGGGGEMRGRGACWGGVATEFGQAGGMIWARTGGKGSPRGQQRSPQASRHLWAQALFRNSQQQCCRVWLGGWGRAGVSTGGPGGHAGAQ
jgi:hypothetical protein